MTFAAVIDWIRNQYDPNVERISATHWRVDIALEEGRSQIVHLLHKTFQVGDIETQRLVIDTPIGPLPKRFDLKGLLRRNATLDSGAICIEDFRNDDNQLITYISLRATYPLAPTDPAELEDLIETSANVADELEDSIFARDLH